MAGIRGRNGEMRLKRKEKEREGKKESGIAGTREDKNRSGRGKWNAFAIRVWEAGNLSHTLNHPNLRPVSR